MAEKFFTHRFDNGLTLVGQQMDDVSSAATTLALPAGAAHDPEGGAGMATVGSAWVIRGAGARDTRSLNDVLDALGCQHHEDAHSEHLVIGTAQMGMNLPAVLPILADIIRQPHLSDAAFEPCRDLIAQSLAGLEDEPMRKCNVMIREMFFPQPLGRNPLGTAESLAAMTPQAARAHLHSRLCPDGTILAVAGRLDWGALVALVGQQLGDWIGPALAGPTITPAKRGVTHVEKPTAQMQIALAYPAVTMDHPRYYAARVAEMVLSGGMSARLFTEVREKRGLVYAVHAGYHCMKGHAGMFVYAGTMPERAQETLTVVVRELRRLKEGVQPDELDRARTRLRSHLVMQGEATSSRADAMAGDWYHLGRLRGLAEISAAVSAITADDVVEYVRDFPPDDLTVLTIGPRALDVAAALA